MSAPGQGAIAVEIKKDNIQLKKITSSINDEFSRVTTSTERSFMKLMGGGCNYPIAALSTIKNDKIKITKLAQGLPVGGEIEQLDDGTLFSAFKNRNEM